MPRLVRPHRIEDDRLLNGDGRNRIDDVHTDDAGLSNDGRQASLNGEASVRLVRATFEVVDEHDRLQLLEQLRPDIALRLKLLGEGGLREVGELARHCQTPVLQRR